MPESRRLALLTLCAGMLMIVLDATIVNVALPSIQHDLGFAQSSLAWVVNAYLIAFGGLLLLAGRLGDLVGRRRVFLGGLALFTAASALCGLSASQPMLIAARFVQGAGGALTSSVILGMIVTTFPQPREQARAIGVFSFVASGGASIGLLAGGVITQVLSWHWIFFVNLPIGVAVAVSALRSVDADHGIGLRAGADVAGALLVTAALMLGVYTIVETTQYGWTSPHTLGLGALAVLLGAAFLVRQATADKPLLPLRVLRSRTVAGANAVQMITIAGLFGVFFLGVLYMQRVLGWGALSVGLAFLPVSVLMGALSLRWTAQLVMRYGARSVVLPGLLFCVAGLLLLSRAPVRGAYAVDLLPSMLLFGVGAGLSIPALTMLAMSEATPSDAGLASGLSNTSLQVGGALGLAVLASIAASRSGGSAAAAALTAGYHLGFLVAAMLVGLALAVAVAVLRPGHLQGAAIDAPTEELASVPDAA